MDIPNLSGGQYQYDTLVTCFNDEQTV